MEITKVELTEEPTGGWIPETEKPVVWFFYRYEVNGRARRTASFPTVERLRAGLEAEVRDAEETAWRLRSVLAHTEPERLHLAHDGS